MVAKSASFGHGSLVCGLWLAVGGLGRGGAYVRTWYILHTFFLYLGYGIPVLGEAHCTTTYTRCAWAGEGKFIRDSHNGPEGRHNFLPQQQCALRS